MDTQTNLFEMMYEPYKITKPIRLIELFGGIGSQAKALENLNANFEHYRLIEFDKYPVASYNAIHGTNFEPKDITKIKAEDLGIVETDKYEYIMTYSFPCQDLSLAGKQRGMAKGSGTRSGLLWEVERLLSESKELPQILLMENVPDVIGKKNISDFQQWQLFLEKLGYKNYVEILNAKDYGIPQNRRRCFMISLLGDYSYTFPDKQVLHLRLKDMLESQVDEKYFLSDVLISKIVSWKAHQKPFEKVLGNNSISPTLTARGAGENHSGMILYSDTLEDTNNLQNDCLRIREKTKKGMIQTIKTSPDIGVVVEEVTLKNRLCNDLVKSNLVKEFDVVDHSYTNGLNGKNPNSKQKLEDYIVTTDNSMPCLTTRPDNLGVVVKNEIKPVLVGGIGVKKSNGGTQYYQQDRVYDSESIAMAHPANLPGGSYKYQVNIPPLRIRKLTPKECYRLMGFSDSDFDKASKFNSNAQLYKQAGNSIVVNVLEAIFKQLL